MPPRRSRRQAGKAASDNESQQPPPSTQIPRLTFRLPAPSKVPIQPSETAVTTRHGRSEPQNTPSAATMPTLSVPPTDLVPKPLTTGPASGPNSPPESQTQPRLEPSRKQAEPLYPEPVDQSYLFNNGIPYIPKSNNATRKSLKLPQTSERKRKTSPMARPEARDSSFSVSDSEDTDNSVGFRESTAPKKARNGQRAGEDELDGNEIVLVIPLTTGSSRRVELPLDTSYKNMLSSIYQHIGCLDLVRKPELSYKLSTAAAKTTSISLDSESDWKGLLKEVQSERKSKKKNVLVNIHIPDRYMHSLRVMGTSKSGKHAAVASGRSKNKSMKLMDLNGDSAESGDDDGMMEREAKALKDLERALSQCQLCGPSKMCKISRTGEHVNLTFNQRRAWAVALANKHHGVTLTTPPKADIFADFFQNFAGITSSSKQAQTAPMMGTPQPPVNIFMPNPWMPGPQNMSHASSFSGMPGMYSPAHLTPQALRHSHYTSTPLLPTQPSSDPPDDDDINPYPTITEFIHRLGEKHPQRNLARYIDIFEEKDFYNIDELSKMPVDRLSSSEFGLSAGNAQFLLDSIQKETKKISRLRKSHVGIH